jgi:hypothetical protein
MTYDAGTQCSASGWALEFGQKALAAKQKKKCENHCGQPFDCPSWSMHLIKSLGFAASDNPSRQHHRYRND